MPLSSNITSFPLRYTTICLTSLLMVTACGGGGGGGTPTTPTQPPTTTQPVQPPTADIVGPQNVMEKTAMTLTGSTNASGSVTYTWQQLSGPTVSMQINGNTLTFETPSVFGQGQEYLAFGLVVTKDGVASDMIGFDVYVSSEVTFEDFGELYSVATLSAKESYLQLAELARTGINNIVEGDTNNRVVCYNGGLETIAHNDNDSNGIVSIGDTVRVTYEDCLSPILDAYVQGYVEMQITEASIANKTITGIMDLNHIEFSDRYDSAISIAAQGDITITLSESATQRNYSISNTEPVTFTSLNTPFIRIEQGTITKQQDLASARYALSIDGSVTEFVTQTTYTVATTTPVSGYFNEYPNQGVIVMSDNSGESVAIEPNNIIDSDYFNLVVGTSEYKFRWSESLEGFLFSFDNSDSYPIEYRVDNFRNIGSIDKFLMFSDVDAIELNFLASRPITSIVGSSITFNPGGYSGDDVPGTASLNGALVTITPNSPLAAATRYYVSNFSMTNEFGSTISTPYFEFTTSDAVIPKLRVSSRAYRQDDYPVLDASQSEINQGSELSFEWEEVTSAGVAFSDPSAAVTTVLMPSNTDDSITSDIVVRLTVRNEAGRSAQTEVTLSHQPSPASFITLDSDQGDYIGQGRQWLLDHPQGMTTDSNDTALNEIVIDYAGPSSWWSMHLTSPNDEPLAIGSYTAQRWPFQPPGVAGFDFSGDGRGCNTLTAEFEIIELVYDEQGALAQLAVDFAQYCEQPNGPALNGQVRFNSTLRINP